MGPYYYILLQNAEQVGCSLGNKTTTKQELEMQV